MSSKKDVLCMVDSKELSIIDTNSASGDYLARIPADKLLQIARYGIGKEETSTLGILYLKNGSVAVIKIKFNTRTEMEFNFEQLSIVFDTLKPKIEVEKGFTPLENTKIKPTKKETSNDSKVDLKDVVFEM